MFTNGGIAEIAEVVHICFRAYERIFDLGKVPHTYITRQVGAWTTMAKRADTYSVFEGCFFQRRITYNAVVSYAGLVNGGSRANTTCRTYTCLARKHCTR